MSLSILEAVKKTAANKTRAKDRFVWTPGQIAILNNEDFSKPASADNSSLHSEEARNKTYTAKHWPSKAERDHDKDYHSSLSKDHKKAVAGYKKTHYTAVNTALRKHEGDHAKAHEHIGTMGSGAAEKQHTLKHLAEVTGNARTHTAKHVYRGSSPHVGIHKLKVGDHFTDHGFTSASHSAHLAHHAFGEHYSSHDTKEHHLVKIHMPKGTKAHHLDNSAARHESKDEDEVLLHHGTTFKVTKQEHHQDEHGNHHYLTHVTVHHQKD